MITDRLKDVRDCLSDKRTADETAYRRQPDDKDLFGFGLGHDYKTDALQKILLSKAYRRLGAKTQVFPAATNAHVRNRLSHTAEVASIATLIAGILGLNENLSFAISEGHDIGHAPFGHTGEAFISEITGKTFRHEVFGVVIAQQIERQGEGLNLTHQVLEGMLKHSKGNADLTRIIGVPEEFNVVMCADKIAYVFCDINDIFEKTNLLNWIDYPEIAKLAQQFGKDTRERVNFCIECLCRESAEKGYVSFETSEAAKNFAELKKNMYKVYEWANVLNGPEILGRIYTFLSGAKILEGVNPAICLALMTDTDILWLNKQECITLQDFQRCSVAELIKSLKDRDIDFLNPDLDW